MATASKTVALRWKRPLLCQRTSKTGLQLETEQASLLSGQKILATGP